VVEDILVRLDGEDLIRCKSVCKSWLSLISSTRFVKKHLDYTCNKDLNNHELGHRRIIMPSYTYTINDEKTLYDSDYLCHDWYIVGSSNGLICISMSTVNAQVLVTNPLTKEVKILQNPPQIPNLTSSLNRFLLCWGFGYDSLSDDYKVVMGIRWDKVGTLFLVLTLKSNTWKAVTFAKYKIISRVGILWNGALHWFMKDCNTKKIVILSFHLSRQEFTEIPQPDDSRYLFDYQNFLGIADKCLCIYRNYSPVQRWVMKTYNDKQSWELMSYGCEMKYDIAHTLKSYSPHSNCYFIAEDGTCFSKNGKFIGSRRTLRPEKGVIQVFKYSLPVPSELARDPAQGMKHRMGRDTVQLETAVSTISQEYLLEFTSEYGIPEALHPELPGPEDRIVDFSEGKVGVYIKFFEFSNFRLPLSRGQGWMSFSKRPGKNTPQCYTKPLDSLKNWNNRFFWLDERVFPTIVDWRTSAPKDKMPAENTYSSEAVRILDTHRTPIQKQPEALLYLVGLSRRYYLGDEVYPTFLHDDDQGGLIRAPNPTKVKTGSRPRAAHEVPLLTVTANRVIKMEDPAAATDSSGVPSTIERSSLDFANEAGPEDQGTTALEVPLPEDVPTTRGAPEAGQAERVATTDPLAVKESRKRGHDGVDANAPPKVLRRDHADPRPTGSTRGGKSLAAIELGMGSIRPTLVPESAPADGAATAGDPKSENTSFASVVGSPECIYRPEWGIANSSMPDTPEACQDLVDHVTPSGYFSELRHLHNDNCLRQYNVNLARQVAMGSQLRLRFEQEAKLLKKSVAQVARRDKRIQAREHEIKNLEALLEAEAGMKKAAEDKSAKLSQELEDMRALFLDLQVSNNHLSQQVATLQEQVSEEEKLKGAFEEFKQYEKNRVEQRCTEMDARLDALSIDFDEELYPHMLRAIASRRWMIGRGLRLAVMKGGESIKLRQAFADVVSAGIAKGMSEGLKHGVEHGQAQLNLEAIEAYDPEAKAKYIAALQALKNLKYPLVDQLEGMKEAPMDVIMAALHLESDTGDDAPQWVRDLSPSSSQLTIPVYQEVRDPMDPWACKEEMLLADAIAANVSRVENKKKFRVVCRTHRVGSAHHARSDGVLVSVPTVVPQGLAILLADAATQTESDEASQLLRSSSLHVMRS
nr:hypothetical protein [Tanacetum cinerariifolium]